MKFTTVLALLSLGLPVLSLASREPLLPAPISRISKRSLWEKWTGADCCSDKDKVDECKAADTDCDDTCNCTPWEGCGKSAEYWCTKDHGTLDENCDCIYPSGYTDPHDPYRVRRRATAACPVGHSACLIDPKASSLKTECLDLLTTLDSCGGCATEGKGVDCTLIPAVEDVSCEYGSCKVYSCEKGFKVENGTACVPDAAGSGSVKHLVISGLAGAEKFWSHSAAASVVN